MYGRARAARRHSARVRRLYAELVEKLRTNPAIAGLLEALGKIATGSTGIMDRDSELAQIAADALAEYNEGLPPKGGA